MSIRQWFSEQHPLVRLYFYVLTGAILAIPLGAAATLLKPVCAVGLGMTTLSVGVFVAIIYAARRAMDERTYHDGY